jgi:hypothetical protein
VPKQGQVQGGAPRQPPQQAHPQLAAPQPPQQSQPQNEDEEAMMFKYYLNMLVGFAAQGRDVSLYADLVVDNVPEDKLLSILNDAHPIESLGAINSGVLQHRAWFDSLLSEVKTILGLTEPQTPTNVAAENITLPVTGSANNLTT